MGLASVVATEANGYHPIVVQARHVGKISLYGNEPR